MGQRCVFYGFPPWDQSAAVSDSAVGAMARATWTRSFTPLSCVGAAVFYNIHVGGDISEDSASCNRFLLNGFVSLFLLAGWTLSQAPRRWQAIGGLLLISYGLPLSPNFGYRWRMLWQHDERGFYLTAVRHFAEGDTLYIGPAGTTPYFFRRYVWRDFLGKVDSFTVRQGTFIICNGPFPSYPSCISLVTPDSTS